MKVGVSVHDENMKKFYFFINGVPAGSKTDKEAFIKQLLTERMGTSNFKLLDIRPLY